MNDLQKEIFSMFKMYLNVCQELNLRYFLVNGSALGSLKYGGFIEWDDDFDIAMPRKDYEVFCSRAQEILPEHIFLQNYRTDKKFPFLYSKLRNSNTTFIEETVEHLDINHGIYIDIFPIDGYPEDIQEQKRMRRRLKFLSWQQFCALKDKGELKVRVRNFIFRMLGFHHKTDSTLAKMEQIVSSYGADTKNWCNYGDRQGKGCIPREYYGEGINAKFEGSDIIVPEKIEDYLTHKYGDWKKELPKDKKKSHHKVSVCDTKKSYTYYMPVR